MTRVLLNRGARAARNSLRDEELAERRGARPASNSLRDSETTIITQALIMLTKLRTKQRVLEDF